MAGNDDERGSEIQAARLAAIVESSCDAILAKDPEGIVTDWNPAAERLYGYTAEEIIGRSVEWIIPPELARENAFILSEVLAGRVVAPHETERLTKAGDRVVVSVSVSPICTASGTVVGASTIARDVTAARAAESEAIEGERRERALERELEQARRLESVGQLAGGVAHDFNNLLSVILNLASFLAEDLPPESSIRRDAVEIGLTAKRAAILTRQLLIFSRCDVNKPEVFDAGQLVDGLGHFLYHALGERVQLDVSCDEHLWMVSMDRGQLEQIVVNLAVNARDAMPGGGRLIIETRNSVVDSSFAETRASLEPGNYVTVTVSDTGVGMSPDVVARAFDPYFTTKAEGNGTGLGLATVYGIAAKVGGRVTLYSELGHGTSVKVHLPATDVPSTPHGVVRAPAARGSGERILVVEDAHDVRSITERMLVKSGYTVATAETAAEAEEIIAAQRIDLVLTDVVMPGTTGPQLVEALRSRHPQLNVIFMSGYSGKLLTDEILAHENSLFIEKPFTGPELRRAIRDLLDVSATAT